MTGLAAVMTLPFDFAIGFGVGGTTFAVTTGLTDVFGAAVGCGLTGCDLTTGAGLDTTGVFTIDLATAGLVTGIGLATVAGLAFTTGMVLAAGLTFTTGLVTGIGLMLPASA